MWGSCKLAGMACAPVPCPFLTLPDTLIHLRGGVVLPCRVEGLKRVVHVAVGEKHSLAVQRWAAAQLRGLPFMPWLADDLRAASPAAGWRTLDDGSGLFMRVADGDEGGRQLATPRTCGDLSAEPSGADSAPGSPEVLYSPMRPGDRRRRASPGEVGVPTLQRLCEEEVARHLVDPRTTLQVSHIAVCGLLPGVGGCHTGGWATTRMVLPACLPPWERFQTQTSVCKACGRSIGVLAETCLDCDTHLFHTFPHPSLIRPPGAGVC